MESGAIKWIRPGTTGRDFGVTGIVADESGFYIALQSRGHTVRIVRMDRHTFQIISDYKLHFVTDPHSLCIHNGDLLIASTGNNAVFHLARKNGDVTGEELYWRYPGSSEKTDDVHLNCLASYQAQLFVVTFGSKDADGRFGRSGELLNVTTGSQCIADMHQPHSILFHNGKVYCTSSGKGEVIVATPGDDQWVDKSVPLRGFCRGLAPWKEGVLVGVSAHRTHSRSQGISVEQDKGVYSKSEIVLLDEDAREQHLVADTTSAGSEIYEIVNIDVAPGQSFPAPASNQCLESFRTNIQRVFCF